MCLFFLFSKEKEWSSGDLQLEEGDNIGISVFHVFMGREWFPCMAGSSFHEATAKMRASLNNLQPAIKADFNHLKQTVTLHMLLSTVCAELILMVRN